MDNDQNPVVFTGPLFACSYGHCAEEVSYPADMLRIYEGQLWCEGCWDSSEHVHTRWCDLQAFVPPWEKHIATLAAERDALQEALGDCFPLSLTYASLYRIDHDLTEWSDGHAKIILTAAELLGNDRAADMARAVLSREGE